MNKIKSMPFFGVAITASCVIALMAVLLLPNIASAQFVQTSPTSTAPIIDTPLNPDTTKLFEAILKLKTVSESEAFFRDLLTLAEIRELATRFKIAKMLNQGKKSYLTIAKDAKTTTATVTRVAHWLKQGMGGYRLILNRLK